MAELLSDNVTVATFRTNGNRYISAYFATLKRQGFQLVSTAAHTKGVNDWPCVYVFEHKLEEGIPRAELTAALDALSEKHIAQNHSAPLPPRYNGTAEVWAHNQRIEYINEARVWAD